VHHEKYTEENAETENKKRNSFISAIMGKKKIVKHKHLFKSFPFHVQNQRHNAKADFPQQSVL
jgi:hypothetical protein